MVLQFVLGTLYGRCKREGIELSRSNPTPWSEDAMNEALASVRLVFRLPVTRVALQLFSDIIEATARNFQFCK